MRIVTPTVYGNAMQTAHYLGKQHAPEENSSLNEKFAIQANTTPAQEERHKTQYYCIGNQGHRMVSGTDGIAYTSPRQHQSTDAACFNHIPFVLREIADDLTVEQRANYGLRRIESHNGQNYVAYYAKRINLTGVNVNMQLTNVQDGSRITTPFVPSNANLNPTPMDITGENEVVEASGEYVASSAVTTINFTELDADELRNVARILYGDEKYSVISEIALVAGIDRIVTGPGPGNTTINYTEIISSQVVSFIAAYYHLVMQNNGFTFTTDLGVAEPLFAISTDG